MYRLAKQSEDSSMLITRTMVEEATFNSRHLIKDSLLLNRILDRLNTDNPPKEEVLLRYALIQNYFGLKDYSSSFPIALATLEDSKQLDDSLLVSKILNSLGAITFNVNLLDLSRNYYNEALKWLPDGSDFYYYVKSNLYTIEILRGKEKSSLPMLDSLQLLIDEMEEKNMTDVLLAVYSNTANSWSREGMNNKALSYLLRAQELCIDNPRVEFIINNNLGGYYLYEENNPQIALSYFHKAKNIMEEADSYTDMFVIYRNISDSYNQLDNIDSAYFYLLKSSDSAYPSTNLIEVTENHRKYITASLEAAEHKLTLAQTEISLKNRLFVIIGIIVFAFVVVCVLVFIILGQKRKAISQQMLIKEAEAEKLSSLLEKEQIVKQNQEEQLENKLREITSYSLLLSNKNQILDQILQTTYEFPAADKAIRKRIQAIVKENEDTENVWADFLLHFNNVHPLFFENLNKMTPDLTQSEIKLAAYIRLGLAVKQIAQMLNVHPDSVKSSRYRLRKKLGLGKEDNLNIFIQNI